jgi:hypothetical protein
VTTDCAHRYKLANVEPGINAHTRTLWLKCDKCGDTQARITDKTDQQIADEIAHQ